MIFLLDMACMFLSPHRYKILKDIVYIRLCQLSTSITFQKGMECSGTILLMKNLQYFACTIFEMRLLNRGKHSLAHT